MALYPYRMQLVVDPDNPRNVVAAGSVSIYDSEDTAHTTLLTLTDPSGVPITNPIVSNANGFTAPFVTTSPEVLWVSGPYVDYFQSYKGMRDEAVAAVAAAEAAAVSAGTEAAAVATAAIGDATADAEAAATASADSATSAASAATSAANAAALVAAPADSAVQTLINASGSATRAALKTTVAGEVTDTASATRAALNSTILDVVSTTGGGVDVDRLTTWGDSLTFSQGSTTGNDWPTVAAGLLGIPVTNNGKAGWASSDIATLMGAMDLQLTITGDSIPASGAVAVTTVAPAGAYRKSSGANLTWLGTLAGIPGTLTHVQSGDTWTFTRTSAGAVTPCPAGSTFHATLGDSSRNDIVTIWAGRNNFLDSNDPYKAVRDTDLMVRRLTSRGRRYLVIGLTNATNEPTGNATLTTILAINALLAKRHGDKFVDIRTHLVQKGMDEAGLYVTPAAAVSIGQNTIPAALMTDTVHMNNTGYAVIAKKIARVIAGLGWVPGVLPSADPVPVPAAAPSLGVSDVVSRFYAPAITSPVDGVLSAWNDVNGAHNLGFPTGSPTLRQLNGYRYVDLGVGASSSMSSTGWDSKDIDFTLAVAVKWAAGDTVAERFVGASGTSGIIQIGTAASGAKLGMWSGASPTLNQATATPAGWHTLIAVFNGLSSALYVDGVLNASGETGVAALASSLGIRGTAATQTGISDFAYINHAVTSGEVAAIHSGLASSIPA